ncbi:MAG: diguanylate cyclase [Aquincola tertiaricarbonis]
MTRSAPVGPAPGIEAALGLFRTDRLQAARAQAEALSDSDSPMLRADAATLLARITRRQGELDVALAACVRAIQAAEAAQDPARECRARVQKAHVLAALGRIEAAAEESDLARRLSADSGDAAVEAAGLEALGAVQWAMGRWTDALASFERMQLLATSAGDLELQAVAQGALASVQGELAQQPACDDPGLHRRRALRHAAEYLRLASELGDLHAIRSARHNQAVAQLASGDRAAARRTFEAVHGEAGTGEARAVALLNLAEMDLEDGAAAAALQRLQDAHALLSVLGDAAYLQKCCELLCNAQEALGEPAAALRWHRQFHAHYVQLASDRAQMHARALEVKFETGRAQAEAEFERLRAERYERAALVDGLTGIPNRRAFDRALATAQRHLADGRPFSLVLLDLDHFKSINDQHSHQVGDDVLRRVGRVLVSSCRHMDLAARYGGEEFALVLPDVDASLAESICERVRAAVEREPWHEVSPGLQVSVSIGCLGVAAADHALSIEALLAAADQRLYLAKRAGRNRVVGARLEAGGAPGR